VSASRRVGLPVLPHATPSVTDLSQAGVTDTAVDGPRIAVVTLGCDKNTVDTERILARLAGAGARIARDADDAEVVLINTCGFIDAAREESVETILDAVRLKSEGRLRAVVAMGCLVQRYQADLEKEIPEVDLFLGLTEVERLVPELRSRGLIDERAANMAVPMRLLATRTSYAAEPDVLVKQLAADEAIAAADTLLLTVPNQLGVEYNAHAIESILKYVAPELGWR
jgi:hypothetical protein